MWTPSTRLIRALRPVAVLSLALLVAGCPFLEDDDEGSNSPPTATDPGGDSDGSTEVSSEKVCGLETLPSPATVATSPCSSGEKVVSSSFTREKGPPTRSSQTFRVETASEVCLTVDNGASGADRISAAWIYVDDQLVFGPDQFSQQADTLRENLELAGGSHELRVKLASKPGASLRIVGRAAERSADGPKAVGKKGRLVVENIAVDHPMFSPNGDGYHDTALFNADNFPETLPGERSGRFSYEIDWRWAITRVDGCQTIHAGLSGTTPVNSPTNVQATWDGTDGSGSVVPDGNYLYRYHARLVRSDGLVVDTVTSTARGIVVDTTVPDYGIEDFSGNTCDPAQDPHNCKCPSETDEGTRCTFAWIPYLTSFESPSEVDTSSFLTSRRDESTGEWEVVVDLRTFNGGGLVPQENDGSYASVDQLQQYVSDLTGVPPDPDDTRLFNFDYTQLGYSTPVVRREGVASGFNHFLLDVITDQSGKVTVGGRTLDLKRALRSSNDPVPAEFEVSEKRLGEECGYNGNTDGDDDIRGKTCTQLRTANLDPGGTDLGIYIFKKRLFGVEINGEGTARDEHCIINGIAKCGVRTLQRNVDSTFTSEQFVEGDGLREVRDLQIQGSSLPSLVTHVDRGWSGSGDGSSIIDGICSDDSASRGRMTMPLDSGAGALPGTCIINGIL